MTACPTDDDSGGGGGGGGGSVVGTWELKMSHKEAAAMSEMPELVLMALKAMDVPDPFLSAELVFTADKYTVYEYDVKDGTKDESDHGTYVVAGSKITTTSTDTNEVQEGTIKGKNITINSTTEEGKPVTLTFKKK